MKELTERQKDILDIQLRVIVMLSEICKLTQGEITEIIENTNLFKVIKGAYFMLHQEGDYANMMHIKDTLAIRGYNIDVPSLNDPKWKAWNMLDN